MVRIPGFHACGTGVIFRRGTEILLQAAAHYYHLQVKATREKPPRKMSLLVRTAVCPLEWFVSFFGIYLPFQIWEQFQITTGKL